MFLNITATITDWSDEDPSHPQCSITLEDNPLADFVELPENLATLRYCSILSGAVRGALEMVNMEVECAMIGEKVRGDDGDVMRVKFKRADTESYPFRDDD
jgi:trafficking protein particle complex subunit 3